MTQKLGVGIFGLLALLFVITTSPVCAYAAAAPTCTDSARAAYDKQVTAAKQAFISAKANASTARATTIERARKDTARKRNYVDKDEANVSLGQHRKKEEARAYAVYNRAVQKETQKRDALLAKAKSELQAALARCMTPAQVRP